MLTKNLPKDLPEDFPARLRAIREFREMTQMEVAVAAGLTPTHISRLERGLFEPGPITRARLARALTVEVVDLFPAAAEASA